MKDQTIAVLIGGLLPAVVFGLSSVFQKVAVKGGIGSGPFLVVTGIVVVTTGLLLTWIERDARVPLPAVGWTVLYGFCWASGVGAIAIAVGRYDAQISQLVPIYNLNTLVAVAVGMVFLGEWRSLHPGKLLLAAVLITVGGVLASAASTAPSPAAGSEPIPPESSPVCSDGERRKE